MAYVIGDDCVSCGACAGGCPVGAIAEGAEHYEIDADKCRLCWYMSFWSYFRGVIITHELPDCPRWLHRGQSFSFSTQTMSFLE